MIKNTQKDIKLIEMLGKPIELVKLNLTSCVKYYNFKSWKIYQKHYFYLKYKILLKQHGSQY